MLNPTKFRNRFTGDQVVCDDVKKDTKYIDGVEYYFVHELDSPRRFLMRKEALEKVGR
jgi:hypothetical protein